MNGNSAKSQRETLRGCRFKSLFDDESAVQPVRPLLLLLIPVSGSSGSGGSPYQFTPTNMIGDVAFLCFLLMKSMSDARKTNIESDLLDRYGIPTYESQIRKD